MTTQQPEALRLADICAKKGLFAVEDELRRLHAESQMHLQELRSYRITVENREARIAQLEAQLAVAQQGAQDAEPAAWVATFKPEGLLALHSVVGATLEELKQSVPCNSVFRPLYTHPATQGLDAQKFLQQHDMEALERFAETNDDNQDYDIGKDAVRRLAGFGCLQCHGFGKYSITDFGHYVLADWEKARELPFKTQRERDAEYLAVLAAQAKHGGASHG